MLSERVDEILLNSGTGKVDISSSRWKRFAVAIIGILLLATFSLVICELLVRFFNPQEYMYPRYKYSAEYGGVYFENTKMIHRKPRRYSFVYTINEYGYRGPAVPISNHYERKNIVVLGDSYSFGTGVNDGEEYPAVLQRALGPEYNVINLGCGGFGLTQEIRRFYEFGRLYEPQVVLLQFCDNDPSDNFRNRVTEVDRGTFRFRRTNNRLAGIKKYLSYSIVQKSQLYNFFRNLIYNSASKKEMTREQHALGVDAVQDGDGSVGQREKYYNELLESFARDLKERGIRFQMIAINNELNEFPEIMQKVRELNAKGLCGYIEVVPWFNGVTNYGTPEGTHIWGEKAHGIVGTNLAAVIRGTR
jgi:hypothetical protein